jgi:predicted nucleic acid-binding protein
LTAPSPTTLYLDSNAIAKLYLTDEEGQATVYDALDHHEVVATCAITYAEVTGLMARAFHDGRLSEDGYREAATSFAEEWKTVKVYDVSTAVSQVAALLMKSQPGLRAMDALHLASALAVRQATPIKFLSFDRRLQDAAGKLMPDAL